MRLTALYAGALVILFIGLSLRILTLRSKLKIALGDGGVEVLQRAQRAHGNCAEYVPFGLLLILLVESSGAAAWVVHSTGLCLLCGRVIHAYGLSQAQEHLALRISGMILTFTSFSCAALFLLLKHALA